MRLYGRARQDLRERVEQCPSAVDHSGWRILDTTTFEKELWHLTVTNATPNRTMFYRGILGRNARRAKESTAGKRSL